MKTLLPKIQVRTQRSGIAGFTMVEMLIVSAIFIIIIGSMVCVQVFGLRVYTLAATKLSATADARKTLNALRQEIRSAKIVYVGTYANGAFSRITNGLPQTGNALQIYGADTNNLPAASPVIYYQQSSGSSNALYSLSNGRLKVMANYMTNYYAFAAEDYQTNILTSYNNNPVIRITMRFYQWEYPIAYVGTNGVNAYNFYRLQTRISRRAKD